MEQATQTKPRIALVTRVVSIFIISGISGLAILGIFALPQRSSSPARPYPYLPNDLINVVTNVRPRPFGNFSLPEDQWGNRSPLIFWRMDQGEQRVLGTLSVGGQPNHGRGHVFTDQWAIDSTSRSPFAVSVGDGGGIGNAQHLTVYDNAGLTTLCLPPSSTGTTYWYDVRGNPYADMALTIRVLAFDCMDRLAQSFAAESLTDGDAAGYPFFDPSLGVSFTAFSKTDIGPGDLGCLATDLVWIDPSNPPEHEPVGCIPLELQPPLGPSPMVIAPHSTNSPDDYTANILMTWDTNQHLTYSCLPPTHVENYSEFFYAAANGNLYRDAFFEQSAMQESCANILNRGFRPDDIVAASSTAKLPEHGSIAFTRGRLRPDGDVAPYFGQIHADGSWTDEGLGGAGSPPVIGDTPLLIYLRNEGNEGAPIVFPQQTIAIVTDTGTTSFCLPQTSVDDYPRHLVPYFIDTQMRVYRDALLQVPAPCTT